MAELTKDFFEEQLNKFATLVANLAEDIRVLKTDMRNVQNTLKAHTHILDLIAQNTDHWKIEMASVKSTLSRHEQWFNKIAEKIGIHLES